MACSLTRCLSFEQDDDQLLLLSARPPEAGPADATAAAKDVPSPPAGPQPPTGRLCVVAELQQFVARLTNSGADAGLGFQALVGAEQRRLLGELARERGGWVLAGAILHSFC